MWLIGSEGVVSREGYKIPTRYTHEQLATMIGSNKDRTPPASRYPLAAGVLLESPVLHIGCWVAWFTMNSHI